MAEIKMLEDRLSGAVATEPTTVKGSMPDHPYTERHYTVMGYDSDAYAQSLIDQRRIAELKEITRMAREYVAGIPDSLARQVITLKYIDGLEWDGVAAHFAGHKSIGSLKNIAYRFFQNL